MQDLGRNATNSHVESLPQQLLRYLKRKPVRAIIVSVATVAFGVYEADPHLFVSNQFELTTTLMHAEGDQARYLIRLRAYVTNWGLKTGQSSCKTGAVDFKYYPAITDRQVGSTRVPPLTRNPVVCEFEMVMPLSLINVVPQLLVYIVDGSGANIKDQPFYVYLTLPPAGPI